MKETVVPALTSMLPTLTPVAAGGLVVVMIGAILTRVRRQEYPIMAANMVLLAFVAFVVDGRINVSAPIENR